jgi:protein-S-isoprenylcysteine O-methyltransferase Ste14
VPIWLRTLIFTLVVPGTFAVYLPWSFITRETGAYHPAGGWHWLGLLPMALGLAGYLWCAWDFGAAGRGTPFPLDAPRKLVIRGLYRHVRNPMYLSVLAFVLGQAALFASRNAAIYALSVWVLFHLFVLAVEEPSLRAQFGDEYDAYRRRVSRWLPRFKSDAQGSVANDER